MSGKNKQKTRSLLKDLFSVSIDLYLAQNIQSTPLQAVGAAEKVVEEFKECVVIVDELDRCRPDFALETLERIKHLFNVKGLKFILVYNNDVFENIIGKTYGADSHRYLEKFIDRDFMLPTYHHTNHKCNVRCCRNS